MGRCPSAAREDRRSFYRGVAALGAANRNDKCTGTASAKIRCNRGVGTAGTANRNESLNFSAECADKYIIECKGVSVYG